MTRKNEPPLDATRLAEALRSGKVLIPRKEFGSAIANATGGDDFPEVEGGYQAWFSDGAALLDEDCVLWHWATAEEVNERGEAALRPPRRPRGPMLAVDSASAGAVIAERFGHNAMESAGYRIVGCGSGIALLDVRNRLLAWLNAQEIPARVHDCPHCRCGHAAALPGVSAR